MGADHVLGERSVGANLVLGVLGGYGEANASIGLIYGSGSIKTKGYSAGATLTWYGPEGSYVDGRAQLTGFGSKLKSAVLGTLADGNNGTDQAHSVEIGKQTSVGGNLSITPQVQTVYSTVKVRPIHRPERYRGVVNAFVDEDGALPSPIYVPMPPRWMGTGTASPS